MMYNSQDKSGNTVVVIHVILLEGKPDAILSVWISPNSTENFLLYFSHIFSRKSLECFFFILLCSGVNPRPSINQSIFKVA